MSLLLLFVRHEARRLWRDRTLPVLYIALTLLLLLSLRGRYEAVIAEREVIAAARAGEAKRLDELRLQLTELANGTAKQEPSSHSDPREPGNVGGRLAAHCAAKPPVPVLALLATGQSDLRPPFVSVTTRGKDTLFGESEIENPLFLLTGRFDPAFVLVYLFPLFALALTYNLLSEEREGGTLFLLRAQSVPVSALLGAKATARWLLFALPVAVVTPILLLLCGVAAGDTATVATIGRLFLLMPVIAAYGAFWFALAAWVNAWGSDSSFNAVSLIGAWLLLTMVVPGVIGETANALYPVPSRAELIEATRTQATESAKNGSDLLARYYEDHPELARVAQAKPVDPKDFSAKRAAVAENVEAVVAPLFARHDAALAAQGTFTAKLLPLSPVALFADTLTELAGTGASRQGNFEKQVGAYRDKWKAHFLPRILARDKMHAADLNDLPRFTFKEPQESVVLLRTAYILPLLAGFCLPLALLSGVLIRRHR